ncbi:MAG: hypothetical protein GX900_04990, partial [Clostridiaceae bacterium]|nr:hypothetical protein [Clostridiaceae bacterium]
WKLTLLDASRNGFTATAGTGAVLKKPAGYATWSVPVAYSGATTGENEKISALLCKDGKALYYGPLANAASGEQSVEVSIPAGLAEGEYLLRVFNEQVNGDGMTDYASPFRDITIKVLAAGTPPKLTSLSVDPIRCAVGTEVKLEVWTCEPEGADFEDEKYYMRDPGTTNATVTSSGQFIATSTGTATVKVKVFDRGYGEYFEQDVQITVYEPIQITTQTLPSGQVGVPYTALLEATGSPTYWDWSSAELPPGLDLCDLNKGITATIEGIPTASGTYTITVKAANNDMTADAYLTIHIAPAATPTPPPGTDSTETDPSGTDSTQTDPSQTDPTQTDPSGTDPGGTDPSGTDPSGTDPTDSSGIKMIQQPPPWTKGSNESAAFTSNAEVADFLYVKVDGEVVDESNYEVEEGSTVVTFLSTFLETLSVGKHPVEIVSKSGTAYGTIEIKAQSTQETTQDSGQETQPDDTTPATGESSGYYLWLAVMLLTAIGLIFLALRKRVMKQRD